MVLSTWIWTILEKDPEKELRRIAMIGIKKLSVVMVSTFSY